MNRSTIRLTRLTAVLEAITIHDLEGMRHAPDDQAYKVELLTQSHQQTTYLVSQDRICLPQNSLHCHIKTRISWRRAIDFLQLLVVGLSQVVLRLMGLEGNHEELIR